MNTIKKWNIFTVLTVIFTILMPFYVLLKVLFEHKFGIPFFGLIIKDVLIVILGGIVIYNFFKKKIFPKLEILDYLILGYFIYGIGITIGLGLSIEHIIYGGRYDFLFLGVFLIYKHGAQFLDIDGKQLIKYFLLSASVSLFLGFMVKFLLGEERLTFFGYSDYASNWIFSGSVPNYHGLENSGVKRFQGILEGPNAMGYFLIVYTVFFLHIQKVKFQFHNVLFLILILWLILLTYSRSALLGIGVGGFVLFLINIRFIYNKFKKNIIPILLVCVILFGGLGIIFKEKIYNAVIRPSSTAGHFERMDIGIDRFKENIYGSGLGTSGPAFRNIYPEKTTAEDERYYIPESWFIQQLTEGGFIYFTLFILIFISLLLQTYKKSPLIFGGLIAIIIMNIFLHIFESTHLTYVFFLILGIIIFENKKRQKI